MRMPDPYRVLFPLGAAYAVVGTLVWLIAPLAGVPYPGPLHRALMIEGFELGFVSGFLLTALPGLTHGERCRPGELAIAALAQVSFGALALAGRLPAAHAAAFVGVALLAAAAVRRARPGRGAPPEEFAFVGLGLALGLAGTGLAAAFGDAAPFGLPARFAERLISLGMVLSLVLGVGGLLVPTFTGMRDPLEIPGIARPHQRPPRRAFLAIVAAALVGAFALEALGRPVAGAWLRAAAAGAIVLLVWKLFRAPGRRDRSAFAMWGSGWLVLAGLVLAALLPRLPLLGLHVTFVGGFGLLTLAIATRVVVAHGGYGLSDEPVVLGRWLVPAVALALLLRVAAELVPARAGALLALAGAAWAAAWLGWLARALPRMLRHAPEPLLGIHPLPRREP